MATRAKPQKKSTIQVNPEHRRLSNDEAAAYLGISPSTLVNWRATQHPGQPPYAKIGEKTVRYDTRKLDKWLDEHSQEF